MTQAKKLKRAIRARARKTGERYTAARRQVLAAREKAGRARPPSRATPKAAAAKPKRRAGVSDASILRATGRGFDHWFGALDAFGAREKGHTATARYLYETQHVPGWHAQMITVAYERDRGLRAMNQSCVGDFQVSVSKTLRAGVAEVAEAVADERRRHQWLRNADPQLARALNAAFEGPRRLAIKRDDYARMRYRWDGATVEIRITGKPTGASIVADCNGLPDAAAVERLREQWRQVLESLKTHLRT